MLLATKPSLPPQPGGVSPGLARFGMGCFFTGAWSSTCTANESGRSSVMKLSDGDTSTVTVMFPELLMVLKL